MNNIMTVKIVKNILCTMALILPVHIGTGILLPTFSEETSNENVYSISESVVGVPSGSGVVLLDLKGEYCGVNCVLTQNDDTVTFFTNAFGANKDDIYEDLINRNEGNKIDVNNIGRLTNSKGELKSYDSFEKGFIEYLYDYVKKNPKKVDSKYVPYTGGAKYVEDLIRYYTKIYNNVDYLTAISIGAAESGYYKVTYMLKYNNVYGGMSKGNLIKHQNIELGVLSFIRLLSYNYYGKGLDTKEAIGKVYCPRYENGVKVASSHWLSLVSTAMKHYQDSYVEITASNLLDSEIKM